jgi:hypothetical protein
MFRSPVDRDKGVIYIQQTSTLLHVYVSRIFCLLLGEAEVRNVGTKWLTEEAFVM